MIRIYVKSSYDPALNKERGFYYLFLFTVGRPAQRYRESGRYECQSPFEAECQAIYKGLDWVCKNRSAIEPIEVYCSTYTSLRFNSQTANYFRPRNEAEASAVGTILQIIGLSQIKVTFLERSAGDDPYVGIETEKSETGAFNWRH